MNHFLLRLISVLSLSRTDKSVKDKPKSVGFTTPIKFVNNPSNAIINRAFNLDPDLFSQTWHHYSLNYLNNNKNSLYIEQIIKDLQITKIDDGFKLFDNNYLKWKLNVNGQIENITFSFDSPYVSMLPIFCADAVIGGDTDGISDLIDDFMHRCVSGATDFKSNRINSEKEYIAISSKEIAFRFIIQPKP